MPWNFFLRVSFFWILRFFCFLDFLYWHLLSLSSCFILENFLYYSISHDLIISVDFFQFLLLFISFTLFLILLLFWFLLVFWFLARDSWHFIFVSFFVPPPSPNFASISFLSIFFGPIPVLTKMLSLNQLYKKTRKDDALRRICGTRASAGCIWRRRCWRRIKYRHWVRSETIDRTLHSLSNDWWYKRRSVKRILT